MFPISTLKCRGIWKFESTVDTAVLTEQYLVVNARYLLINDKFDKLGMCCGFEIHLNYKIN